MHACGSGHTGLANLSERHARGKPTYPDFTTSILGRLKCSRLIGKLAKAPWVRGRFGHPTA